MSTSQAFSTWLINQSINQASSTNHHGGYFFTYKFSENGSTQPDRKIFPLLLASDLRSRVGLGLQITAYLSFTSCPPTYSFLLINSSNCRISRVLYLPYTAPPSPLSSILPFLPSLPPHLLPTRTTHHTRHESGTE